MAKVQRTELSVHERGEGMTEDTKKALEIVKPIADFLHIEIHADNNFLFCNGQAIGITYNSTYATVYEFIGYLIDKYCDKKGTTYKDLQEVVHRTWYNESQMKDIEALFGRGDDNV